MWAKILIYILMTLVETAFTAVIVSSAFVEREIREEQMAVYSSLGPLAEQSVRERADSMFKSSFYDTDVIQVSFGMFVPSKEQQRRSKGIEDLGKPVFGWFATRLKTFWESMYQSCYRLSIIFAWLPYCIPIAIPALIDGLVRRRIKKDSYGYASPVRYHSAMHIVVFLIFALPMYLAAPIAITPLFVPLWTAALAIALSVLAANVQKQI